VDENGMPESGSIYAIIQINNVGYEEGQLDYYIDEKRAKVPAFLDNKRLTQEEGLVSTRIAARRSLQNDLIIHYPITLNERQEFAKVLKRELRKKRKYYIPLIYWTVRVDGKTRPKTLKLMFDIEDFYRDIMKIWENDPERFGL
jgi:hypothetical protein